MKKILITVLIILAIAAGAYYFYSRKSSESEKLNLVTSKAQRGYIARSVTATGTVQPVDTVSVGAQVSGVVKNVFVDFNDAVKQGELIAKVDPSIISAQVEQARATLANAQSNLEYQQSNYDRQNQLYSLGAISKADYQLALNQYTSAKAAVANSIAQVKLAEKNLNYTDIYSPINGVVLNRNVSAGQTIASSFNAPTLFVIARDLTKMQVWAAVDEADIGGVAAGQPVTFTVDAFPDDIFRGSVQEIRLHAAVSANVVTYTTLINVDNRGMKLKPGMTANITIYTQEDSNALLIPSKALNFKPDTAALKKQYIFKRAEREIDQMAKPAYHGDSTRRDTSGKKRAERPNVKKSLVWIVRGDTLVEKKILTGMNDDSNVEVIKGLTEGDEVITGAVTGEIKATDNSQRSPFMPQMRRPSTNRSNQRSQ
jgi:HlyD family secretion protein